MRTSFVLGLVSVLAIGSFAVACAPTEDESSLSLRRGAASGEDTTGGDDSTTNDGQPSVGETQVTPNNPNATSSPTAPAKQGTASSQFALALDNNTPAVDIGNSASVNVSITPANGFTGPVEISVSGLPAGATADPVTATVANGVASATVKINVGFNTPATASGSSIPLVITGTGGGVSATANANFKVNPHIQLDIPMNIDALRAAGTQFRDEWGSAFGSTPTTLLTQSGNPVVVNVFNNDSKAHIIHAGSAFGGHGDTNNPIQPGTFEQQNGGKRNRSLAPGVNATGYPHDGSNGSGASFQIKIGTDPTN